MKSIKITKNLINRGIKTLNKGFKTGLVPYKYSIGKCNFSTLTQTGVPVPKEEKRTHGGLSDSDRIFTNVYNDGDQFVEGALKRVYYINLITI